MICTIYKFQRNINLLGESIQGHWVMSGPTSTTWHTPSPRPNHIYHPASYTTSITYIQRLRNVSLEENVNFSILRSIHKSFAFYMRLQMPGSYRGLRHSWYIQPFGCQTHLLSLCLPVILLSICILYVVHFDFFIFLYFLTHLDSRPTYHLLSLLSPRNDGANGWVQGVNEQQQQRQWEAQGGGDDSTPGW